MKKLFSTILVLGFLWSGNAYAGYFKNCELSQKFSGNYTIDFERKTVTLRVIKKSDKSFQDREYKIRSIEGKKIFTEKKQTISSKKHFLEYTLDANDKSATTQRYRLKKGAYFVDGPKKKKYCKVVNIDYKKSVSPNIADELNQLNELYKSGTLTKDEFEKGKEKLLNK